MTQAASAPGPACAPWEVRTGPGGCQSPEGRVSVFQGSHWQKVPGDTDTWLHLTQVFVFSLLDQTQERKRVTDGVAGSAFNSLGTPTREERIHLANGWTSYDRGGHLDN